MCKKLIFLVSLVAILGLAGSANAQWTIYWDAGGGDNLWDTGNNWVSHDTTLYPDNTAPSDATDNSRAGVAGNSNGATIALIDSSVTASSTVVSIGTAYFDSPLGAPIGAGELNMTGGTLTAPKMFIGQSDKSVWDTNDPSYFNMSGGTVTSTNVLVVGRVSVGYLNMTGGVINADRVLLSRYPEAALSTLNLDGALITARTLTFRDDNGLLDISNYGVMKLTNADSTQSVWNQIALGNITGDGYGTGVHTYFDGTDTIITPEPATMMLLGLGGLFLVRRKR